jgi:hypothetical protein
MAIDADGNFFNPYSPGSYEYEMEEGTRGQEPTPGPAQTFYVTPDPLRVQQPTPPAGFNTFNQITSLILSVATLSVPLLGEMIGAAILEGLGITGATAAVEAGVGAAALSAGSTAAQGGNAEDILKGAATAGFASGINVGMGGGVAGAATGSFVGSAIQGGSVDQILTNAVAAGAGAGVQGILGPAAGTIVRDLIKTGEVSDQTLIRAAISEVGAWNKSGDRSAPIVEGQPVAPPAAEEPVPTSITLEPKAETPAATPETAAATFPPVAVTAPIVTPTVTDVDVMKQVAAQQPTVPLEKVTVSGQGSNVAPVETTVPSTTVPSTAAVATPTPAQPFPTPTITPVAEPEKEAPVVTDIPPVEPPQTEFEKKFISETVPAPVTTGPEFQQVTIREAVPPPVDATEFEQKTIRETVPKASDVVTETLAPPAAAAPSVASPTELEKVTVTAKRDEEPAPTITDIVAKTMEPPPAPPPPAAPEVKAEEPKKEEPKKESKKLYPTVTSVPPPARPGRQPIITGVSPARLLADALAAYRPAGAIEGEESGKERQNVWNEKSLRLKDALGL